MYKTDRFNVKIRGSICMFADDLVVHLNKAFQGTDLTWEVPEYDYVAQYWKGTLSAYYVWTSHNGKGEWVNTGYQDFLDLPDSIEDREDRMNGAVVAVALQQSDQYSWYFNAQTGVLVKRNDNEAVIQRYKWAPFVSGGVGSWVPLYIS